MFGNSVDAKIEKLRRADFGSWAEAAFRYVLVTISITLVFLATRNAFFLYWIAAYLLAEFVFAVALHVKPKSNRELQFVVCLALYNISALIFLACPLYLITLEGTAYVFVGTIGLVGLLLYNFHRGDVDTILAASDAVQFTFAIIVLFVVLAPRMEGIYQLAAASFACLAVLTYYYRAILGQQAHNKALRASQMRYAQSQKARALTQFVGGVAHDFNNILTAILGNLELYSAVMDEKERDRAVHDAQLAAQRAAMTVRQLLATSGRARLRPVALKASCLHAHMTSLLNDLLDRGITLHSEVQDPDFAVFADRDMLDTVLIQLCLNAQDALKGRGMIWLKSRVVNERPGTDGAPESAPPYLAITIEDDGPGVDAESLPMLAEPFFTTKAVGQGPGLGLSSVKGFAQQSGGALSLENRPEGGLSATLLLPKA